MLLDGPWLHVGRTVESACRWMDHNYTSLIFSILTTMSNSFWPLFSFGKYTVLALGQMTR